MVEDPLIELVRRFSLKIRNGRTLRNVLEHGQDEMNRELAAEITLVEQGEPEGVDGVVGESMDVILCMLDAIFVHNPRITDEELLRIAAQKCLKWARKDAEKRAA